MFGVRAGFRSCRCVIRRPLVFLLVLELVLLASARFGWFGLYQAKTSFIVISFLSLALLVLMAMLRLVQALVFRRRIAFDLRSLFLLTVVIAIPCSWLGNGISTAFRQHRVVEDIKNVGGSVTYDYEHPQAWPPQQPPGPAWMHRLFGVDLFGTVIAVDFERVSIGDFDLRELARLPGLTMLSLAETGAGDRELEQLKTVTQLQGLDLCVDLKVNYRGLKQIEPLKQLRSLRVTGKAITDNGIIRSISGMATLEYLSLEYTAVSDAGLASLRRLPRLKWLDVRGTNVTAAGVEKLRRALPACHILMN